MDYKTIMDKKHFDMPFNELYEHAVDSIQAEAHISDSVRMELSAKRRYGLEKYGEYSFQSSLSNLLNSPSMEHLREEILDAMNYAAQEVLKSTFLYPSETGWFKRMLETLGELNTPIMQKKIQIQEISNAAISPGSDDA